MTRVDETQTRLGQAQNRGKRGFQGENEGVDVEGGGLEFKWRERQRWIVLSLEVEKVVMGGKGR